MPEISGPRQTNGSPEVNAYPGYRRKRQAIYNKLENTLNMHREQAMPEISGPRQTYGFPEV